MSALTGVGPSIASGSQMCNGNMALLPAPPTNISPNAKGSIIAPCIRPVSVGVKENVPT